MGLPDLPAPLASAITSGDVSRVQQLHEPNIPLESVAQHAAEQAQPEVLEWCFEKGWSHPEESLNSKFFLAAICGSSPAIYKVLVDHGFDLNAHYMETVGDALACAVSDGNYELAKWLLEHGHEATPKDPMHGPSAISWTICQDTANQKMLELLLDHGHDLQQSGAGVVAADEENVEALRLLLDRGLNLEDRDIGWYTSSENTDEDEPGVLEGTALYYACRWGNIECVELLLERGADPQAKDVMGKSCLDIARHRGHEDVVQLLEKRIQAGR